MSESFEGILSRVSYGKYIDAIQDELNKIANEVGPGRTARDAEAYQDRLQGLLRTESMELAKELGLSGSPVMIYMLATSIISTAWVTFTLRREASDLSKSPEDRLATIEMLDAMGNAMNAVVASATNYADRYPAAGAETAESQQSTS